VRERVAAAPLVGLLLGKAAAAHERGVELRLTDDSWLADAPEKVNALTTIVGNLVDNALDAVTSGPTTPPGEPGLVEVTLRDDDSEILIEVSDNGPGVPEHLREKVFLDGFTTKVATQGVRRGIGLALVHRLVQRLHGTIALADGPGARFVVHLPVPAGQRGDREVQHA
jgi:two-component system CitB family sensor kinase